MRDPNLSRSLGHAPVDPHPLSEQALRVQIERLERTLQAHSRSDHALLRATDETSFLEEICEIIANDCGHAMVWVGYAENDEAKSVRPVAYAGFEEGYLETLRLTWADSERGRGPTGTAIRTGKPSICPNMLTDPRFAPWREQALKRGYASSIALPMIIDGQTIGALTIYSRDPDPFSEAEVKLLSGLADDLTYGVNVIRLREAHAQAEAALRESEVRYRSLFEGMVEGFALHEIVLDAAGKPVDYVFLEINPAFERLTGLKRADTIGRRMKALLPNEDERWVEAYGRVALTGQVVRFENYSVELGRWYETFSYRPAPGQFAVIFTDVTDRVLAAREREKLLASEQAARAEAESAVRIRDQFIALASHELKTPLTSLRGYAELLIQRAAEDHLSEQDTRMVRTIHQQTLRLEKMISGLLDISRIERGQLSLDHKPLDLSALVDCILRDFQPTLRKHKLQSSIERAGLIVDGDETRLEQVLQNLLQNAVKYSPSGGTVTVRLVRDGAMGRISVADEGIGIPVSALPHMFTRFYRAANAEESHIAGLGVGLYVAHEIVRLHGGDINVTSREGKGSEFTISIPLLEECELE